jgi:hypothetical protein
MNPEQNEPAPEPLKASPQPLPSENLDGGRAGSLSSSSTSGKSSERSSYSGDDRRAKAYSEPPRFNQPQEEPAPVPKPKNWLLPVIAALILAVGLGGIAVMNHGSGVNTPPPIAATQSQNILTVTGADADQAATDRAIVELKSGTPEPLLAALPDQVKQEILSGDRKFYRIPPQVVNGDQFKSGDRISVDFNGTPYGTYDLSQPVTLDMPLKIGDQVGVHCISVAQGKSTLTADLATVLNPVRCQPLAPGQSQELNVQQGAGGGQNYQWFEQEAASGNPVAQYGLGHMYQYGLGVAQNNGKAVHWYQQAAAQNYMDAQAQLQLLQSNP